jgi:hypothetical protein
MLNGGQGVRLVRPKRRRFQGIDLRHGFGHPFPAGPLQAPPLRITHLIAYADPMRPDRIAGWHDTAQWHQIRVNNSLRL